MRRLASLAGIALLAASLPGPAAWAHAGHGPFVQWNGPEWDQQVSGTAVHISGTIVFGTDGVKSWAVEILAPAGQPRPSFGTVCEEAVGGAPRSVDFDCSWDTTGYPDDGGLSHNGEYLVRVRAENTARPSSPTESHVDERPVTVVNPVSGPKDVKLTFVESSREASVHWTANPEPDVLRYIVQQRSGNGAWQTAGETGPRVTRLTRKLAPGTYSFQVAAVRQGPADKSIQSAWSGPAAEPKQVIVAEPPAPKSTTSTTSPGPSEVHIPTDDPGPSGSPASSAAAGDPPAPAADGSAPAGTPGAGRSSFVTPIQAGAPGSVTSRSAFGTPSAGSPARPAPKPKEYIEPDAPFSETLPYPKQATGPVDVPDESAAGAATDAEEETELGFGGRISDREDDRRAALVPLAGGLLLLVAAMWAWYVSRRSAEPVYLEAE